MVSALSSRLLAGRKLNPNNFGAATTTGREKTKLRFDACEKKKKRPASTKIPYGVAIEKIKNEAISVSGYSADREGGQCFVQSDRLHPNHVISNSSAKRQKRNEMRYAATTVQRDLKRAGIEFKQVSTDIEICSKTFTLENEKVDIIFKDRVNLVRSNEFSSNTCAKNSMLPVPTDYAAIFNAVKAFYPSNVGRLNKKNVESFEKTPSVPAPRTADDASAQSSTAPSSLSDNETDYESDNKNNNSSSNGGGQEKNISISPLLDDFLTDLDKKKATTKKKQFYHETSQLKNKRTTTIKSSSVSNVVVLTDFLQLSKTPRLLTTSSAPFSIIHANAAFQRLSANETTSGAVVGKSLFSILEPKPDSSNDEIASSLEAYMLSMSTANRQLKLRFLPKKCTTLNDTEYNIKVSPVATDSKTNAKEEDTMEIQYIAIELDVDVSEDTGSCNQSTSSFLNKSITSSNQIQIVA